MRRFLLVAVVFGLASGAQAADMPDFLRGSLSDGLTTSRVNWGGFYLGGQAGYGTSNMNFTGATRSVAARLMSGLEMEQEEQVSSGPSWVRFQLTGKGSAALPVTTVNGTTSFSVSNLITCTASLVARRPTAWHGSSRLIRVY